ncbi:MAG: GntR family transcriptional regulator [Pseudomonadota bacterium]
MTKSQKGSVNIQPLSHEPLHERLYASLRTAIMRGEFEPGRKLTVRELASLYGTSPMPVRAALSRLVTEGGLEQGNSGQVRIPRTGKIIFQQIMELRALLEGQATAAAVKYIDGNRLKTLNKLARKIEQIAEHDNVVEYLDAQKTFKHQIYEYAENPVLFSVIENLWLKAGPQLSYLSANLETISEINFHNEALAFIEAKQAKKAADAISKDILAGMQSILDDAQNWADV